MIIGDCCMQNFEEEQLLDFKHSSFLGLKMTFFCTKMTSGIKPCSVFWYTNKNNPCQNSEKEGKWQQVSNLLAKIDERVCDETSKKLGGVPLKEIHIRC